MKIDNKSFLKKETFILICLSILIVGLFIAAQLMPHLFPSGIANILGIILIALIFIYTQFRYIEFDSTGEVLIFKTYHPIRKGALPHKIRTIELPKQSIKKHHINSGFLHKELVLSIQRQKTKKLIKIKLNLSQMDSRVIKNIHLNLEEQLK